MKLSVSNIGWGKHCDELMYTQLKAQGYTGLEIAPTRIFELPVYEKLREAAIFAETIKKTYGISISSLQSIWFGRRENIFGTAEERETLLTYTKRAIDFAHACGCPNLVFGCPKNRVIDDLGRYSESVLFFRELGNYAFAQQIVIAMEANPPIYNTNFINRTDDAILLVKEVASKGFRVNLDFGTILENEEDLSVVAENLPLIHHVHISEPFLAPLQKRMEHRTLARLLQDGGYDGFVSLEMKNQENPEVIIKAMDYVREVFMD